MNLLTGKIWNKRLKNKCKICNGSVFIPKYRFPECNVIRCTECGLVQVKEKIDTNYIYSKNYFSHGKRGGGAVRFEQKRRIKWLKKCGLKPGSKLLDAGCATGEFLSMAVDAYDSYGIDISEYAVEQAIQQYPFLCNRIKIGSLEQTEFEASFDAVVMWDVIEHLQNPRETISRLIKLLKPGGLFVVSTPNIGTLTAKLSGEKWPFMTPPEHQSFFDTNTLDYLMQSYGLSAIKKTNKGKWVNVRFLLYKLHRVLRNDKLSHLLKKISHFVPAKTMVYAATSDILYAGYEIKKDSSYAV